MEQHAASHFATREQELLLRAAIVRGPGAVEAWTAWKSAAGGDRAAVDRLDGAAYRLLPLLWRNLAALGVRDPLMDRLKGIYRHAWALNQTLIHETRGALAALHESGIPTLVLKGAALIAGYYRDPGVRPMADLDVLVPTARAADAMGALEAAGYRSLARAPRGRIRFWHSTSFKAAGAHHEVDLHWRMIRGSEGEDDLWAAAVPATFGGIPTRALGPTDLLLHVCAHGATLDPASSAWWVADAMAVLGSGAAIDWPRLVAQAAARRSVLRLRETLDYLRRLLDAPVPEDALERLRALPVSRREAIEFAAGRRPMRGATVLLMHWFHYRRAAAEAGIPRHAVQFPEYLRVHFELPHLCHVPFYVIFRALRRLIPEARTARRPQGARA